MKAGRYGRYGGQYIPETLMNAVQELDQAYEHYKNDPEFQKELVICIKIMQDVRRFFIMQRR